MQVYIVSDIFGLTPALGEFITTLYAAHSVEKIHVVDPYQGKHMNFLNEEQAYTYFSEHVGVEGYAEQLLLVLMQNPSPKILIGFSVGASAIWANAENIHLNVKQAFYFYGSQIRHLLHVVPQIKSTVILPYKETHFSVDSLQSNIENLPNVSTNRCEYLHGFMNKHSINFNQQAYTTYSAWLCQKLR